jgi:hypothetical protein
LKDDFEIKKKDPILNEILEIEGKEILSDWLIDEFQSNFYIEFNITHQFLMKVFIDRFIIFKLYQWEIDIWFCKKEN